jgi:hypothetical protein
MRLTKEKLLGFVMRPFSRRLRLRFELDDTNRLYRQLIADSGKTKNPDMVQELYGEWHLDSALIEEELRELETRRLVNKARRLMLPVPEIPVGKPRTTIGFRECISGAGILKPKAFPRLGR